MTINWGVFWTPEFLIGTVIIGLLLQVVGTYMVRSLDWVVEALPASFRRARDEESARIQRLTAAATSDHALYAALVAEIDYNPILAGQASPFKTISTGNPAMSKYIVSSRPFSEAR